MDDDALMWIGAGIVLVLGWQAWKAGRLSLATAVGSSSAVPVPTSSAQAGGIVSQPATLQPTETDTGEPTPTATASLQGTTWRIPTVRPAGTPATTPAATASSAGSGSGGVVATPYPVHPSPAPPVSYRPAPAPSAGPPHFSQVPTGYSGPTTSVPTQTEHGMGTLTVPVITSVSQIPTGGPSVGGTSLGALDQAVFQAAKEEPAGYTGYIHVPLPGGNFTDVYASGGKITVALPTGQPEAIETG